MRLHTKLFEYMILPLIGLCMFFVSSNHVHAEPSSKSIERVAVLDLANKAGVNQSELDYLTDSLRRTAGKLPKEHYLVITKENILVILPPGKTLADCEGTCAVDTGRKIGAHWVLVGEVVRFGETIRVTLKLHHTASGALRASDMVKGKNLIELEKPLQRSALSLFSTIDARVGRSASLERTLVGLEADTPVDDNNDKQDEKDLATKLAALEEEDEVKEDLEINSDDEYEAELKQLTELAELKKAKDLKEQKAKRAHRQEVDQQWTKVLKINRKSAKQGIKAIRLFLETYQAHKYGNHRKTEAEDVLNQSRERLITQRKTRLSKKHRKQVEKAWNKAKRLVKRGDNKAQKALDAFIEAYQDHPLGNPLAAEAQAFFSEAQAKREAGLIAAHRAKVERSWNLAKRVVKRGDRKAEKALKVFLEAYADHERGNHLADVAQSFYDEAKLARENELKAKHLNKVKQEWAKLKPILKAKGKTADKAIKMFIKRYEKHPLGNPLAKVAQESLEANARGEDPSRERRTTKLFNSSKPKVRFQTNMGEFVVELDPKKAPLTVENFLAYVDSGYYTGTIFHRVIKNFMIQGGGLKSDLSKKPTRAPIVSESKNGLSNIRGTIAVARRNAPNSGTSQFFINVVNNRNLDTWGGGYAVFGKVISGMNIIDKIQYVQTSSKSGHRNVPVEPVIIKSAKRVY